MLNAYLKLISLFYDKKEILSVYRISDKRVIFFDTSRQNVEWYIQNQISGIAYQLEYQQLN